MIITRMGNEVEIIGVDYSDEPHIWIKVKRKSDGKICEYGISDLKADDGTKEIFAELEKLPNSVVKL